MSKMIRKVPSFPIMIPVILSLKRHNLSLPDSDLNQLWKTIIKYQKNRKDGIQEITYVKKLKKPCSQRNVTASRLSGSID